MKLHDPSSSPRTRFAGTRSPSLSTRGRARHPFISFRNSANCGRKLKGSHCARPLGTALGATRGDQPHDANRGDLSKFGSLIRWSDRRAREQRGFTLIELLVVVIILGLLAALVGPRFFGRVGQSKQAAAKVQIELLGTALDQFKLDTGRYPTTQEGLPALQASPGNVTGWEGPYLKKDVPRDPWGNPYQYKSPGDHGEYDLWSHGADNTAGGEGEARDITSWGSEGRSG